MTISGGRGGKLARGYDNIFSPAKHRQERPATDRILNKQVQVNSPGERKSDVRFLLGNKGGLEGCVCVCSLGAGG